MLPIQSLTKQVSPHLMSPKPPPVIGPPAGGVTEDWRSKPESGAVPESGAILGDAIRQMSVDQAKEILDGPPDAATRYCSYRFDRISPVRASSKALIQG